MAAPRRITHALAALLAAACGHGKAVDASGLAKIPAGSFAMGSDASERGEAVELAIRSGTYDQETTARLRDELPRRDVVVPAFAIMTRPVTQAEYQRYMLATGAPEPYVDRVTWDAMRTGYAYTTVQRERWHHGAPQPSREDHPAVLVAQEEAAAYCEWWGRTRGGIGRLPSEAEWEKAARGIDGRAFPWGDDYDPQRLNAAEARRGASSPVGQYEAAASPYGVSDMAGNVFEWTSSRFAHSVWVVKGGAFNAGAVSARCAARHGRAGGQRHVAIGFRCVLATDR